MIEVSVHHGDIERALPVLKKIIQKEGMWVKIKKQYHEKKSEKIAKKKAEARKKRRYQQERIKQRYGI